MSFVSDTNLSFSRDLEAEIKATLPCTHLYYNLPSDEILNDSIERHVMKKSNKSSSFSYKSDFSFPLSLSAS